MSDNQGDSYSVAIATPGCCGASQQYKYGPTTGSSHTFSVSGADSNVAMEVQAWSHAQTTGATGVTSIQTGSVTRPQTMILIIAALNYDQGSSLTLNGGFTISNSIDHSGSNYFVSGMAYLVQSTAAAVDPTFTWTGFGDPSAVIASYK